MDDWGFKEVIAYCFCLLIGWFVIAWLMPDDWKIKYAMTNFVSYKDVSIEVRPIDCDFLRAPIGKKDCHYEKTISKVLWKRSPDGLPVVSYDRGETWTQMEPSPDSKVKIPSESVYVGWNKVEGS